MTSHLTRANRERFETRMARAKHLAIIGCGTNIIAARMGLSRRTVRWYLQLAGVARPNGVRQT